MIFSDGSVNYYDASTDDESDVAFASVADLEQFYPDWRDEFYVHPDWNDDDPEGIATK